MDMKKHWQGQYEQEN